MATSDSDSSIASDSDFDPAQYEPAALQYEPIGLKLYNPGDVAYEPEVVLREPNKHLSVYNRETKSYVRGYGGSGNLKEFYNALPPETKKLVDGTGFKGFIDILGETSNDHVQLTALAEMVRHHRYIAPIIWRSHTHSFGLCCDHWKTGWGEINPI